MILVWQGLILRKAVSELRKLLAVVPALTSAGVVEEVRRQECLEAARPRALLPATVMAARTHTTTGIPIPNVACLQQGAKEQHRGVATIIIPLRRSHAEARLRLLLV